MENSDGQKNGQILADGFDLAGLVVTLWRGRRTIFAVALAGSIISVFYALTLPNIYRAEALVAPNFDSSASGLSSLASRYGSLASLAGINLGASGGTDKTTVGIATLRSRAFLAEFIERHGLLVPLLASKDWDAQSGELVLDEDIYDEVSGKWVRKPRRPRGVIPTYQEGVETFQEILSVNHNSDTGFVLIRIDFVSPILAKRWIDLLIEDLNAVVVKNDISEAKRGIKFLEKQIQSTSIAEVQKVFNNLIEEQTKTVMLAEMTDEYLFKTIDPAIAPELKLKPKRSLIVLFITFLSAIAGAGIVLLRFLLGSGTRTRTANS